MKEELKYLQNKNTISKRKSESHKKYLWFKRIYFQDFKLLTSTKSINQTDLKLGRNQIYEQRWNWIISGSIVMWKNYPCTRTNEPNKFIF